LLLVLIRPHDGDRTRSLILDPQMDRVGERRVNEESAS
jgi:hypothetical protein